MKKTYKEKTQDKDLLRVQVVISKKKHADFKILCFQRNMTISNMIRILIEKELNKKV